MRECLFLLLLLAGCARMPPPPVPQPRYEIGQPYQLGGVWSYPREEFGLAETGLAVVLPSGAPRRTRNGDVFDGAAMVAAHRTLQLPAIVTLTNLENGRSLDLRVVERGPEQAGRIAGVSRRAGELLGVAPGGVFQARLEVQGAPSQALARGLPGDRPAIDIVAAPVGRVERETLAAPAGARLAAARTAPIRAAPVPLAEVSDAGLPPARLPETVRQGAPQPGRLVLDGGVMFTQALAQRQAARFGGRAEASGPRSRQQEYRLRAGPFGSVAEADAALARARTAGVGDARIIVE